MWELRGHLALVSGDAESAVEKFAAALRESHDLGFRIALPRGLASLAEALAARGDSRAAAVVVASAEAAERALGVGVDPWEEARRRELVADLARRLGDHEYVAARAEGLQLSPEDAVAYALAAVD